jgi:hypothetical protein
MKIFPDKFLIKYKNLNKRFFSKAYKKFTTKRGKLISKYLAYVVLSTYPSLKIKTKEQIKKLLSNFFKQQKKLGLLPTNFNFLRFFNLNQMKIRKTGRFYHIDLIVDGENLSPELFTN